jgi:transposase
MPTFGIMIRQTLTLRINHSTYFKRLPVAKQVDVRQRNGDFSVFGNENGPND